jgi:uncharacterized protein
MEVELPSGRCRYANARARRIDERRVKESPSETGRNAAMRLATAILMYSFGGLRRDGAGESEFLPPGITEAELLASVLISIARLRSHV